MKTKGYAIADIGSNWAKQTGDDLALAKMQIKAASDIGADAAKFQMFTGKELYGYDLPDKSFELNPEWLPELAAQCTEVGIDFMCSAFSEEGIGIVDPFVNMHKIASPEMLHVGMVGTALKTDKIVLVSTGGAHDSEIEKLSLLFGGASQLKFMECVSSYPAPWHNYDLTRLERYNGISDHTKGNVIAAAANTHNLEFYEFHFDAYPDRCDTPDSPVSKNLIEAMGAIHTYKVEMVIGKFAKPSENESVAKHRRRLKIIRTSPAGSTLRYGVNFGFYRSLNVDTKALGPFDQPAVEGKILSVDKAIGDGVNLDDVK